MVAYDFRPMFVGSIRSGNKRQTIRSNRRRHARPGEPMQLYTGMRTKACAKVIDDPLCEQLAEVHLDLRCLEGTPDVLTSNAEVLPLLDGVDFRLNNIPILGAFRDWAAADDGFYRRGSFTASGEIMEPFVAMMIFWMEHHGPVLFEGVLLQWQANPERTVQ